MNDTLINVSVPYVIEYVRRGCSKVESGVFWEDRAVVIQSVAAGRRQLRLASVPEEMQSRRNIR
jgi:hypothetical protein